MSDQNINNQTPPTDPPGTPPAAEPPKSDNNEHMIPKSRFDEVNNRAKDLETRLTQLEAERKSETEKRLAEQEKWQELAEKRAAELVTASAKAKQVETYEETLQNVLAAQLEELPEDLRDLVPEELSTQQKLSWLSRNKAKLTRPNAPDIGAGKRGGQQASTNVELTQEELRVAKSFGYDPEEYAKFKDKE